jgi:ribA/ribD-fused uncharacterized protein
MSIYKQFSGKLAFASNFYEAGFVIDGIYYRTVEHFYQSEKALYQKDKERIRNAETSGKAKRMGKQIQVRSDWDAVKKVTMSRGVYAKFSQNPDIACKLLAADDSDLVERNSWGDTFWGVDSKTGKGEDNLGKILRETKQLLLKERKSQGGCGYETVGKR